MGSQGIDQSAIFFEGNAQGIYVWYEFENSLITLISICCILLKHVNASQVMTDCFYIASSASENSTHQFCSNVWWRHQMETFSALLAICAGKSPVTGEFPAQRPVTRSFDVFFNLRLNKRLSKQSWGWWFETPTHPLWRHCNIYSAKCHALYGYQIPWNQEMSDKHTYLLFSAGV